MKLLKNSAWHRRGCSLLWSPSALVELATPSEVVSVRQFFRLARAWPADLPSGDGSALVVAGVEGCLDALSPDEAAEWIEGDLKPRVFAFQDEYEGAAALVFWLPSGRTRRRFSLATGEYGWALQGAELPLGRLLWSGAQGDAERIMVGDGAPDIDGDGWIGLYHPRIS
jgi:hypothetical protein